MKTNLHNPLADRMRPKTLAGFLGQKEIIGKNKLLRQAIKQDRLPSIIFWGPPGSGKTTLAFIIAKQTKSDFQELSAVSSGLADLRQIIQRAESNQRLGQKTILFIDEIHRWNKKQQDALLPCVERGTITLIGATTENPSFEVISALLSRCRVFVLHQLTKTQISKIIKNTLKNKTQGLGNLKIKINQSTISALAHMSNGDARTALNVLEYASSLSQNITLKIIKQAFQKSHLLYDKDGEEHYNIISALHKSMRGSDENASLYWLARMLEAGEDPLYIARRLVRFASEDIGLANSKALEQAVAAYQACYFIGMPECNVILAQAVVYMAKCKKSNQLYRAYNSAKADIKKHGNLPVPLHIRNAPTKLMKNLGYGKDYKYSPDHDYKNLALQEPCLRAKLENKEKQDYLPKKLNNKAYF
ncbi:AAA family ATPase [bacterium]|nr:AAA family ATPase [bacterium]|tara:strand:+ start:12895 stop:14145 length:1251 start_codon:yes stop_codon:yes gene_type:complete